MKTVNIYPRLSFSQHMRCIVERLEDRRLLSAGVLDKSFGDNGAADAEAFGPNQSLQGAVILPNGKFVAFDAGLDLARFNADGSLDRSFGNNGQALLSRAVDTAPVNISAIALQPDGKIVAVGEPTLADSVDVKFWFLRFLANGRLDPTFGNGGIVILNMPNAQGSIPTSLALQPDGRILAGGLTDVLENGTYQFAGVVVGLTSSGALDQTFGNKGIVDLNQTASVDTINIKPNGDILAQNVLLDGRGQVKTTFNATGLTSGFYDLQKDGKFVAVFQDNIIRYNADGSVDTQFGNNGAAPITIPFNMYGGGKLMVDASGRILFARGESGFDLRNGTTFGRTAVERFTSWGQIDSSYGLDGISEAPSFRGDAGLSNSVLQPDGRVIVLGGDNGPIAAETNLAVLGGAILALHRQWPAG